VSAKDKATGKEQSIRIEASSGLSDEEIERMRQEAEENAEEDQKRRERADTINEASSMVYTTQQNLDEYGDKISDEKRSAIEASVETLEEALEGANADEDISAVESGLEDLNEKWQAASQEIYQAQQEAQQAAQQQAAQEGAPAGGNGAPGTETEGEAKDVDYEVVDEGDDEK
jgi:molecular chaperone DnaK